MVNTYANRPDIFKYIHHREKSHFDSNRTCQLSWRPLSAVYVTTEIWMVAYIKGNYYIFRDI